MKSFESHMDLMLNPDIAENLPTGERLQKCTNLLKSLSATSDKYERTKLLRKFRDAYHPLFSIRQFSSITTYETWINS